MENFADPPQYLYFLGDPSPPKVINFCQNIMEFCQKSSIHAQMSLLGFSTRQELKWNSKIAKKEIAVHLLTSRLSMRYDIAFFNPRLMRISQMCFTYLERSAIAARRVLKKVRPKG